jgi:hypothetical protein
VETLNTPATIRWVQVFPEKYYGFVGQVRIGVITVLSDDIEATFLGRQARSYLTVESAKNGVQDRWSNWWTELGYGIPKR